MMSRGPDDFTEEELLRISRPVDPSTLPKGRESVRYRVPKFPHSSATFNIILGSHIQVFS